MRIKNVKRRNKNNEWHKYIFYKTREKQHKIKTKEKSITILVEIK